MSIFKDWYQDNRGFTFTHKVAHFFSPNEWLSIHEHRKQRADRGWSDRDTWGAGEHIARITAEMLQHLNDNTYTDWPGWFELNVQEENSYSNLQQIIDDINDYLKYTEETWADDLETKSNFLDKGGSLALNTSWHYKKSGKKLSEKQLKSRIIKWSEKEMAAYEKAQKAMQFFGRHFANFWD